MIPCEVSTGQPRPYIPADFHREIFGRYHRTSHPGMLKVKLGHAIVSKRFDEFHLDIIGSLPTVSGYRYCITIVDRFTRCPEPLPVTEIHAEMYQSLPTVLLGLRTTIHENLKATSAELVFGENLRLPGDFQHDSKLASPSSFLQQLRNTFADLRPVLPSHQQKPFIFSDLATCTHVFVRTDSVRTSLHSHLTKDHTL
ncbi:integrase_H2C2 domain-containing protein [Trichonephila inaurata madagascariensis]|uniref:Integrase_H2C2 domain-containing protein n=1 Tax=Trichonephila inaurata madagascariensis TaxID=2747483 RepID=A0A8X6JBW3_9ARAC|nr:integrase_H2C2 domain-containing protein [Trichonephila inaurata madagascariensis]